MLYASDYGQICQIARAEDGNYTVTIDQGCGFFREFIAGQSASQCREWIKFHFGRA